MLCQTGTMMKSSEERSRFIARLSTVSGRDMREGRESSLPRLNAGRHRLSVNLEEPHSRLHAQIPRFSFSARSATAAIFILVVALSFSVTLLVIQGSNNMAYPSSSLSASGASGASSASATSSRSHLQTNDKESSGRSHRGRSLPSSSSSSSQTQSPVSNQDRSPDQSQSSHTSAGQNSRTSTTPPAPASTCSGGMCADGKVNVNAATAEQLQTVKGIGPSTAQKIIDYRKEHGNYASIDDLMNVSGIGPKKLAQMRDSLVTH